MKSLTVVIPTKNEERAIQEVINSIPLLQLNQMDLIVDILVVDSSSDNTAQLAEKAGAKVIKEFQPGYGRAYKTGFYHALGDIIVTLDADMTYPSGDIPNLVKQLEEMCLDFITTNRFSALTKGAMSGIHKFGNTILNLATRILYGLRLHDSQSGMWIFRKRILDRASLRSDSMAFSEELKIELCHYIKCRWAEVPIQYKARVGKAKIQTWKHGLSNLWFLFEKRFIR